MSERDPNVNTGLSVRSAPISWTVIGYLKAIYNNAVSGVAGSPSGGVQSVQGVPNGTKVPISSALDSAVDVNGNFKVVEYDVNGNPIPQGTAVPITPGMPTNAWTYSSPTGGENVTSTANIVLAAAPGLNIAAKLSDFIINVVTAAGTASEFTVADGSGAILIRDFIPTVVGRYVFEFKIPRAAVANQAINFKLANSLVTGKYYLTAGGFNT